MEKPPKRAARTVPSTKSVKINPCSTRELALERGSSWCGEYLRQVATRVVWLHEGIIRLDGPVDEVVPAYLRAAEESETEITPAAG